MELCLVDKKAKTEPNPNSVQENYAQVERFLFGPWTNSYQLQLLASHHQSVNQSQIYWTLLHLPFEEILTVPALYQEGHLQVLWFASDSIWGVFEQRMLFSAGRLPFQSITLMPVLCSAALQWLFPLTIFRVYLKNIQEMKPRLRLRHGQ